MGQARRRAWPHILILTARRTPEPGPLAAEVMALGKKGAAQLLEKAAERLDLPADLAAGAPRVELIGRHDLRMENHRGILAYDSREIHVSGGQMVVRVRGDGLELRAMNSNELHIMGTIFSVELD